MSEYLKLISKKFFKAPLLVGGFSGLLFLLVFFTPTQTYSSVFGHFVSTIFFSIYYYPGGSVPSSGWTPVDGWPGYDSRNPQWAVNQIKDMMVANIDVVFHEWDGRGADFNLKKHNDQYNDAVLAGLRNFFQSYRNLVEQNYAPPKIGQWVNHEVFQGSYSQTYGQKLDVCSVNGESYYYNTFIAPFWVNYFSILGPYADSSLAKRANKAIVSLDYPYLDLLCAGQVFGNYNTTKFNAFLQNIKNRFQNQFGYALQLPAHPELSSRYSAIDETHNAFGPGSDNASPYFYKGGRDNIGKETIEIIPGFWHVGRAFEEIFRPREGGKHYTAAWQKALGFRSTVNHVGITSWNYYPEGSQIEPSQTNPNPNADYPHPSEVWGPHPRYYLELTSQFASQWNDVPANDSRFISQDIPNTMIAGQTYQVKITFQNTGDNKWRNSAGYQLALKNNPSPFQEPREILINDSFDEIPKYGGIFRGRPKTFHFTLTPKTPGLYSVQWQMIQQGVEWFGQLSPTLSIAVQPASSFSFDAAEERAVVSNGLTGLGYWNPNVPPNGAFRATDRHVASQGDEFENYWANDNAYLLWAMSYPGREDFRAQFGEQIKNFILSLVTPDEKSFYIKKIGPSYQTDPTKDFIPSLPLYALARYAFTTNDDALKARVSQLIASQASSARVYYSGNIQHPESAVSAVAFLGAAAAQLQNLALAQEMAKLVERKQLANGRFELSQSQRHLQILFALKEIRRLAGNIALGNTTLAQVISRAENVIGIAQLTNGMAIGFIDTADNISSTGLAITQAFAWLVFQSSDAAKAQVAKNQLDGSKTNALLNPDGISYGNQNDPSRLWFRTFIPADQRTYVEHGALEAQAMGWIYLFSSGSQPPLSCPTLSGYPQSKDLDQDGRCEDASGNGLFGFGDLVVLFKNMDYITTNQLDRFFDCTGNGRFGFGDLVCWFRRL